MKQKTIDAVIKAAQIAETARKTSGMSDEAAIGAVIGKAVELKLDRHKWFDLDDYLRKRYETAEWFWLIRRIRNNPDFWKQAK